MYYGKYMLLSRGALTSEKQATGQKRANLSQQKGDDCYDASADEAVGLVGRMLQ